MFLCTIVSGEDSPVKRWLPSIKMSLSLLPHGLTDQYSFTGTSHRPASHTERLLTLLILLILLILLTLQLGFQILFNPTAMADEAIACSFAK